ncbi:hypothetical protein LCGC14_1745440 [marine sediment metagenome]|uniref:Uncharacterized protein n=1 Tax=marine sediment metagenome TaxID=412755 RepID=A0A0F9K518_9ZZZZ
MDYKVSGFLEDTRYRKCQGSGGKEMIKELDGLSLDEIELAVTFRTPKEVDDLIMFLEVSKMCFLTTSSFLGSEV